MPKVSVIVPNYNHAVYLVKRIESILQQSWQDFELIILDDCSTDNSREVIELYRHHPKVTQICYNSVNSGSTFKQWNKGISVAKGEYIWMAESDDHAEPSFLEATVQQMEASPKAGIVYTQSREFEEATNKSFLSFHDHPKLAGVFSKSYCNGGKDEIAGKLVYENTIPNASAVLFRKEIYLACGGADENMRLCGDWLLWVNMLAISDVCYIAEPLNHFRFSMSSVRLKQGRVKTLRERLRVLQLIQQVVPVKAVEQSQFRLLREVMSSSRITELNKAWKYILDNKDLIQKPYSKAMGSFMISFWDRLARKF